MAGSLQDIKARLTAKKVLTTVPWHRGLSTGSTLLNLACSGRPGVGFLPGGMYYLVGDSSSGKTFLTLTCMAEAAASKHYDDYAFIYDNAENGALMDFARYFGKKMASRLRPPAGTVEDPVYSSTVEQFYFHVDGVLKQSPAIYVLDSMDALTTEDEGDKFQEHKKAAEKGKEASGSYGTSKAKLNSTYLRVVFNRLRQTGSILIVISQTRDNIGFGAQFNPKTRSGGRALTFYSHLEIWSSVKGHIKTTYKGKPREQGIVCQLHVKKNRLTGRDRKIEIPILHSLGIDDVGSLVDWLVEEGRWNESKGRIDASDFSLIGFREKIIKQIQDQGKEKDLRSIAHEVWNDIEEAVEVKRRPRYS